jgi:hypothetical protein
MPNPDEDKLEKPTTLADPKEQDIENPNILKETHHE